MLALWTYRNFVWRTALADLRHRYAGSGLGVVWNVVTPLAMLSIYGFIFANAFSSRLGSGQVARATFALYLSSGFLPWAAFADCVTRGTNAFIVNAAFLKKMAIPEQVFVAQTAVSATIGMLISLGLLGVLALVLGAPGHWSWLLLPLIGILWQILGFGLGLALGALNVFFRDVSQLLGVALQIWMWSLPVVYLEDVLPDAYRASLPLNPGYPFLHGLRAAFIDAMLPDAWTWGGMLGWGLVATLVGYAVLHGLRAEIRDHL